MTAILRLQGLAVQAGTEDIRSFFEYLHIPAGGVYIVGGSLGEAFIAFATKEDARRALNYTGNFLKGSAVTLYRSSMAELEHKLESLMKRKKKKKPHPAKLRPPPTPNVNLPCLDALPYDHNTANPPSPTSWPLDPCAEDRVQSPRAGTANPQTPPVHSLDASTAFLLGVCTILQGLQSPHQSENDEAQPREDFHVAGSSVEESDAVRTPELTLNSGPGYVRLFGLPASATKEDICHFFKGLEVQEAIVNVKLGVGNGCLVKFASAQDACDALRFNRQSLGPISVEVRGATEKMWTGALQECESAFGDEKTAGPRQNPLRETANLKQKPTSALQTRRPSDNQLPCISSPKPRFDCGLATTFPPATEYVVMVRNLPQKITKTDIKELFGCPTIAQKNVLHLLDNEGNRTDTAFLIFNHAEDCEHATSLAGCRVGNNTIEVSPITKETMRDMMARTRPKGIKRRMERDGKRNPNLKRKRDSAETPSKNPDSAAQTCLLVRNMPADVKQNQIKSLFCKYKLREDDIGLLRDSDGRGIGEAVVQFKSQKLAALAHGLHGQDFLGTKVLLTCINRKQMEDILASV